MMRNRPTFKSGFTLIELLVVIAVILLIIGMITPLFAKLIRYNGVEAGINTVSIAVTATRAYSTRDKPNVTSALVGGSTVPIPGASYSGTGMIFTPGGEIRLVENDQTLTASSPLDFLESRARALDGYSDIPDRDYIRMPSDAAVVGIARADDAGIRLLAPPFGIRFTKHGSLVSAAEHGNTDGIARIMFYDSNYDNMIEDTIGPPGATRGRAFNNNSNNPYNPDQWTPGRPEFESLRDDDNNMMPGWDATQQKWRLPFEGLESCVGVFVYSIRDFRTAGHNLLPQSSGGSNVPINNAARDWIIANGEPIFFGRYSGTVLRDNSQ